ncbi:sugar ABC transporter ATP-binding protein [Clostridium sp. AM58-1XD]|uniref:sugar ABC transporter ATP-binding protein n=1 Tax=Clostridium sp. AM58-1XD TaxID=2292307 RepID=UPI000E4C6401|nr:sugar ABC transporter ATP-binding protein [Clostridium sp. AM58-1XD]RGY98212.1 sugar ABC transporter ATP-binding protein [Clostridium sp. AM58-1XD]
MVEQNYLEMLNISKTFPGAKVLSNIDFRLKAGEVRALMGENGAGKSTLMKILGGIYDMDKDGGKILIEGNEVKINDVKDAQKYGISIIHQELCLAANMTVFDNLFMGNEIERARGFLDDRQMKKKAQAIIEEMGLTFQADQIVSRLSIAEQQMVEICKALLSRARVIVMDEPTSSLTANEIEQLFVQIEKLKKSNIAIVYISHRMDEIFRISDSITILRDGHLIDTVQASEVNSDQLIEMMVGRQIDRYMKHTSELPIGAECLRVEGLTNKKLKNVSFHVSKGEIVGFAGLVGAGRTETARAVFGIDRITSGEIYVNGKKVSIRNASDAIGCGIGYVPENRKEEGIIPMKSIKYNMTLLVLKNFIKGIGVNARKESEIFDEYSGRLSIKYSSSEQLIRLLSGGNQQKVIVSKWLATKPDIIILDEPTRGIDIGAKTEIYQLIVEMAKQGVGVIMISSEMEEIINLSTRIYVMYEGRITGEITEEELKMITQEKIMYFASGGDRHE